MAEQQRILWALFGLIAALALVGGGWYLGRQGRTGGELTEDERRDPAGGQQSAIRGDESVVLEELRRLRAEVDQLKEAEAEPGEPSRIQGEAPSLPLVSLDRAHTNSLAMRFVPVDGVDVLFGVWETRRVDYAAFANAVAGVDDSWRDALFDGAPVGHEPEHPVVNVSWLDAEAFCRWLTEKERDGGAIGSSDRYRLPTDREWSIAVGLPFEDGATPKDRVRPSVMNNTHFPWGGVHPPNAQQGNYAQAGSFRDVLPEKKDNRYVFKEVYMMDPFTTTAPVGSFLPNAFGLYDLGGNAGEWVQDRFSSDEDQRVVRGGTFNYSPSKSLLSAKRLYGPPSGRYFDIGFRCVLELNRASEVSEP